jgi:hypothetical protein
MITLRGVSCEHNDVDGRLEANNYRLLEGDHVAGNSLTHVSVPIKAWRLLPVEKIKEEE